LGWAVRLRVGAFVNGHDAAVGQLPHSSRRLVCYFAQVEGRAGWLVSAGDGNEISPPRLTVGFEIPGVVDGSGDGRG